MIFSRFSMENFPVFKKEFLTTFTGFPVLKIYRWAFPNCYQYAREKISDLDQTWGSPRYSQIQGSNIYRFEKTFLLSLRPKSKVSHIQPEGPSESC